VSKQSNPITNEVIGVSDGYIKQKGFCKNKACKDLLLSKDHVCNNNISLCQLQADQNEHMQGTHNVLQRDIGSSTQATGDEDTLQGRVSSGGSPGCARINDNEGNDTVPDCDKNTKQMRLNNACCGAFQWVNITKCGNFASGTDAGHKECAGGQGKAHRDPGLGNPGHQFGGGIVFSRGVDEIKTDTSGSEQTVVGDHTYIDYAKVYPEDQDDLGLINEGTELTNSQDLESLLGEYYVGSMPSQGNAHASSITSKFGFIPLYANHAVQGPVSDAAPTTLWGKRDCNVTEKYYNFNT
jgi:hypothetical protein